MKVNKLYKIYIYEKYIELKISEKILDNYLEDDKHILNNSIKPINMIGGGLFNNWNFEDFSEN